MLDDAVFDDTVFDEAVRDGADRDGPERDGAGRGTMGRVTVAGQYICAIDRRTCPVPGLVLVRFAGLGSARHAAQQGRQQCLLHM